MCYGTSVEETNEISISEKHERIARRDVRTLAHAKNNDQHPPYKGGFHTI